MSFFNTHIFVKDPNLYRVSEKLLRQTEKIAQIIQQCWDLNVKRRPSFLQAHDQIEACFSTEAE